MFFSFFYMSPSLPSRHPFFCFKNVARLPFPLFRHRVFVHFVVTLVFCPYGALLSERHVLKKDRPMSF